MRAWERGYDRCIPDEIKYTMPFIFLQFEWAWQHPHKSRRLGKGVARKKPRETPLQYRFRTLTEMLSVGPWCRLALTIRCVCTACRREAAALVRMFCVLNFLRLCLFVRVPVPGACAMRIIVLWDGPNFPGCSHVMQLHDVIASHGPNWEYPLKQQYLHQCHKLSCYSLVPRPRMFVHLGMRLLL